MLAILPRNGRKGSSTSVRVVHKTTRKDLEHFGARQGNVSGNVLRGRLNEVM